MSWPIAAWRATYTPGSWFVLAGPTVLVVTIPGPPHMSALLSELWEDILKSRSMDSLSKVLSSYGLDQMPDFAAFFWDDSGLRGLARGSVKVSDAATGEPVLDGTGLLTWDEDQLGIDRRILVEMEPVDQDALLHLPLAVGAVTASSVYFSTEEDAPVRFASESLLGPLGKVPELQTRPESPPPPKRAGQLDIKPPAAAAIPAAAPADFTEETTPQVPTGEAANDGEPVEADDDGGTVYSSDLASSHKPAGRAGALAIVRTNQGANVTLDMPVLIGRSPNPEGAPKPSQILKVSSPANNISRNHIFVSPSNGSIIVTDLNSTNGTTIVQPGERPFILANGESVEIKLGTLLDLGDGLSLRIEPAAAS